MAVKPYTPTPEDTAWLHQVISVLRDGGVLGMKVVPMAYVVGKTNRTLRLTIPGAWKESDLHALVHHHNAAIAEAIGWKVLPEVDWAREPPEEVQGST